MENLTFTLKAPKAATGTQKQALTGVVASGNLEVLVERVREPNVCEVNIATAAHGFAPVWQAVVEEFVARRAAGGLRISINDGGARPDTVALRLAQGVRLIEENAQ
ncbi:malonate decarboxylase acyl carrier protein [Pseudomonas typographi]|uniref:Malonate decarboxylase acyl carrier protein n=1 Tax=Pseudomonas typographi TaxID=2715964 RepID=A0ABR7YZ10_9PSED|nr:malonate decarboxylase acyl carrier protein [Pseudomonas typographi]MBD1550052.1 malonate decarboxylase acyl carrier protein [Pseudomonas typographi]MBD1585434.1 malonate decarboxylase acyl carrier protein [Pseudomonas typographi]MBD1598453.1 malonate decarboxylase acyl carrier protein [Pseudomonas typographi]